jgi:hypothetical protein
MKELLWWILEKLLGKDILHYKVNVQLGALVLLIIVSIVAAWQAHNVYWRWNELNEKVQAFPTTTSNIVNDVVLDDFAIKINTIEQGVIQSQVNEGIISQQVHDVQSDVAKHGRQLDRLDDYLFDKEGVKLDYNWWPTNLNN